jgi:hypothetical protein
MTLGKVTVDMEGRLEGGEEGGWAWPVQRHKSAAFAPYSTVRLCRGNTPPASRLLHAFLVSYLPGQPATNCTAHKIMNLHWREFTFSINFSGCFHLVENMFWAESWRIIKLLMDPGSCQLESNPEIARDLASSFLKLNCSTYMWSPCGEYLKGPSHQLRFSYGWKAFVETWRLDF